MERFYLKVRSCIVAFFSNSNEMHLERCNYLTFLHSSPHNLNWKPKHFWNRICSSSSDWSLYHNKSNKEKAVFLFSTTVSLLNCDACEWTYDPTPPVPLLFRKRYFINLELTSASLESPSCAGRWRLQSTNCIPGNHSTWRGWSEAKWVTVLYIKKVKVKLRS